MYSYSPLTFKSLLFPAMCFLHSETHFLLIETVSRFCDVGWWKNDSSDSIVFYSQGYWSTSYFIKGEKLEKRRVCKPDKSNSVWGFPGGAVVGSLPANAGDMGSSPGLGGSHMLRSGWAREPQLLSLRVWSLCSATGEAAIVRGPRTAMGGGPRSPQLEKALAQKRRPNTAKNKNK